MTGYRQELDREKTRAAGIDQHFVKPIELEVLLRAWPRVDRSSPL